MVVDLYSTWYERDLGALLRANLDLVVLVQVCDYTIGTTDMPNRSVVGDGDIPHQAHHRRHARSGLYRPLRHRDPRSRVEAEGYRSAIARSAERASELLDQLGA